MSPSSTVEPRPYRLHNQIQHYAWGTRDAQAFIPRLLGLEPEESVPYAELWMGTHPNAPSQIELPDGTTVPLSKWISQHPEATLGKNVAERYGGLPFLFKVLSAGQSLSIQAHPTKEEAERLHEADPEHYPDPNHKPEVAVALDTLAALMGFKPWPDLAAVLVNYPEIASFVGDDAAAPFLEAVSEAVGEAISGSRRPTAPDKEIATRQTRDLFTALIRRSMEDPDALAEAVDALARRLGTTFDALGEAEERFLSLRQRYGSREVGLLALFLFNLVHLTAGQGLYTEAGVPHAYLGGNIVECMANSDNVVRVGLTPKYKDAETLLEIIDTTPQTPTIMEGDLRVRREGLISAVYPTPAEEFEVRRWTLAPGTEHTETKGNRPAILLVTSGSVDIAWNSEEITLEQGDTLFLPACLDAYTLHAVERARLFEAYVPLTEPGGEA